MQNRRGFMRTVFGAVVGVATGGFSKVAEALTTKAVAAKAIPWDAKALLNELPLWESVKKVKGMCEEMVKADIITAYEMDYRRDGDDVKIDVTLVGKTPAEFVTVDIEIK